MTTPETFPKPPQVTVIEQFPLTEISEILPVTVTFSSSSTTEILSPIFKLKSGSASVKLIGVSEKSL